MELALNQPAPLFKRLSWFDWLFAAIVVAGGLRLSRYGDYMDLREGHPARDDPVAGGGRLVLEAVPPALPGGRRAQPVRAQLSTTATSRAWKKPSSSST
jgi:hypothetical protein